MTSRSYYGAPMATACNSGMAGEMRFETSPLHSAYRHTQNTSFKMPSTTATAMTSLAQGNSASAAVPNTTTQSSSTSYQAPTTRDYMFPPGTTDFTHFAQPTATPYQPSATAYQPTAGANQPSATAYQPTGMTSYPATMGYQPSNTQNPQPSGQPASGQATSSISNMAATSTTTTTPRDPTASQAGGLVMPSSYSVQPQVSAFPPASSNTTPASYQMNSQPANSSFGMQPTNTYSQSTTYATQPSTPLSYSQQTTTYGALALPPSYCTQPASYSQTTYSGQPTTAYAQDLRCQPTTASFDGSLYGPSSLHQGMGNPGQSSSMWRGTQPAVLSKTTTSSYTDPSSSSVMYGGDHTQLYKPEGAMYVSPGESLKGGMHPLYSMGEVRTYEAAPVFSAPAGADSTQPSAPGVSDAPQEVTLRGAAGMESGASSAPSSHIRKMQHRQQVHSQRMCC